MLAPGKVLSSVSFVRAVGNFSRLGGVSQAWAMADAGGGRWVWRTAQRGGERGQQTTTPSDAEYSIQV